MSPKFWKWIRRNAITYSIVVGGALIAHLVRWSSGQFPEDLNQIIFFVSIIMISVTWESIRYFNILFDRYYPFERSVPRRIMMQVAAGVAFALLVRFIIYEYFEPFLPEYIRLDPMFLAATWVLYALASSFINLVFIMRYFFDRWKESLVRAERLEKEKAHVQFDNLKNQLNPHFLFNALTSLNSLIFDNQELASRFLQHLSKVYRYVLQHKDRNFVPLHTELDFIQNYVFLLETRFENQLGIRFIVDNASREKAIVPVTLQILIENALKHNVVDKDKPLSIEIKTNNDYLVVSNNLQIRKLVETSNRQGLERLRSLYAFLTEKPVIVEQTATHFAVSVPLI
jgi:two-component system, LytTR family, sensor kinase